MSGDVAADIGRREQEALALQASRAWRRGDPFKRDSDGDGIPDGEEIGQQTNLLDPFDNIMTAEKTQPSRRPVTSRPYLVPNGSQNQQHVPEQLRQKPKLQPKRSGIIL